MATKMEGAGLGHGPLIMGFTWSLTGVAIIAVALRFYLRAKIIKHIGWDDWIMLLALAFQIANSALTTVAFHYGLGMHDYYMTFDQLVLVLKYIWLQTVPGIFVSIFARISVIILLTRIFGKRTWFKIFLYTTGVIQTCLAISLIPVMLAQCTPVQGLWDPTLKPKCWNPHIQQDLGYAVQSMFTFGDLTYVVLPCIFVWQLNMSFQKKLGLVIVLCLGLFTMAASIIKVTVVSSSSSAAGSQYNASIALLWAILEQLLVIIMGCIPPLMTITKVQPPSFVRGFMTSISSLVSSKSRKPSSGSGYPDSDASTRKPSSMDEISNNEKRESVRTYQVSSVHEPSSMSSSLKDHRIHMAVDYTVDHDRESV